MKIFFLFAVAAVLAGCAAMEKHDEGSQTISDGVWAGTLKAETILADNSKQDGSSDLLIASCNGIVRIWASTDDGKYHKLGEKYVVRSYPDSHLIYFLDAEPKQPDWVEIQSYTLLEIGSDRAILQWTRAVNNRDVDVTKKNRYFLSQGIAELRRSNRSCVAQLVP
jgi:uncharacterized protein YceK